jgi:hypothetical protein
VTQPVRQLTLVPTTGQHGRSLPYITLWAIRHQDVLADLAEQLIGPEGRRIATEANVTEWVQLVGWILLAAAEEFHGDLR